MSFMFIIFILYTYTITFDDVLVFRRGMASVSVSRYFTQVSYGSHNFGLVTTLDSTTDRMDHQRRVDRLHHEGLWEQKTKNKTATTNNNRTSNGKLSVITQSNCFLKYWKIM